MSENEQLEYGSNSVVPDQNNHHPSCKPSTTVSSHSKSAQPSESSKCLQLRFLKSNPMPDVVYSGKPLGQEVDASIEVALVDGLTGNIVKSGSEASAEVEILVLDKAFNKTDTDNWTAEEYRPHILPGRGGKTSLLAKPRINLSEGRGSFAHVKFTHSRNHLHKTEVRLGARVVGRQVDSSDGIRVREAISEAFIVKDRRGMSKMDYPLSFHDKVSRLENIGRDGPSHKKLRAEGIVTVKDFLTKHLEDPQCLQDILGETMSSRKLEATIDRAKKCQKDMQKHSHFLMTSEQNAGVVFNVQEEMDLPFKAKHDAPEMVSGAHKGEASDMVAASLKNWGEDVDDDSSKPFLEGNSDGNLFCDSENEHQRIFYPLDPLQHTIFTLLHGVPDQLPDPSPADQYIALDQLPDPSADDQYSAVDQFLDFDFALYKAQRRWKLLFCMLRWFTILRIVKS